MKKLMIILLLFLLTSCGYFRGGVGASQVGLRMHDGVSIDTVVGPGRYSDAGWYARLVRVDTSAQTITWTDPDLVTRDKQPIGLELAVTYVRTSSSEAITDSWTRYNAATLSNEVLQQLVASRIPRVAKDITTNYSLDEMLGVNEGSESGRGVVTSELFTLLEEELAEINVTLLDVGINNISPSTTYLELIEEKANAQVAVEVARAQTARLQEQLTQEEAQTNIALEEARRANLVAQEEAKAFDLSERAYELRKLELMAEIFSEQDKMFFIPQGTDLTLLLSGEEFIPATVGGSNE